MDNEENKNDSPYRIISLLSVRCEQLEIERKNISDAFEILNTHFASEHGDLVDKIRELEDARDGLLRMREDDDESARGIAERKAEGLRIDNDDLCAIIQRQGGKITELEIRIEQLKKLRNGRSIEHLDPIESD